MPSSFSQADAHGAEPFRVFDLPQVRGHLSQPAVEAGRLFRSEGGRELLQVLVRKVPGGLIPQGRRDQEGRGHGGQAQRRLLLAGGQAAQDPGVKGEALSEEPKAFGRRQHLLFGGVQNLRSYDHLGENPGPLEFPQPLADFRQGGGVQGLPGGELLGAQDLDQEIAPLRVTGIIGLAGVKSR